jgi:aspartyl-tRNA(Asn)/glutamyl-tRNA(Gln) amidotransferase subunit A
VDELWRMSALELRGAISAGEVKPSEVTEAVLRRIDEVNPKVNAFFTVTAQYAMAQARAADDKVARGKARGALFGIPVSIKDLIFTRGIRTSFGSLMYEHFVPDEDEVVVERIKAAGGIILGKTTTCEFGYKAVTDSLLQGVTRNPWALELTPAGSSGGAGAAVATGMGPLAVGSDGGGSIRLPASFCGVFGFKPSRGRIPIYPVLSGWETLDRRLSHLGPITRTVGDAALLMDLISGPDPRDPVSLPGWKRSFQKGLGRGVRGLKMAWSPDLGYAVVEPMVKEMVESGAKVFSELGAVVEEPALELPCLHEAFQLLFASECAAALGGRLGQWRDRLDPGLVRLTEIGMEAKAQAYADAMNQCHLLWDRLRSFFEDYDLLLTPVAPVSPFPLGVNWPREVSGRRVHPLNYLSFTYPFNLSGLPAASVPCGWTEDGLPVGLQIVGGHLADSVVLRASAAFEEARPWRHNWPNI